jgi:tetratricopeptide (TPR) repeat protein
MSGARDQGERAQSWNARVSYGLQLYMLRRAQGRLAEVHDLVRRSADKHPTYPICRCVLAQTAAELGHFAEAREALGALAEGGFAGVTFDEEWLVSVGLLAETAAALEEADLAAALYEQLLPWADRVAISYAEISTGAVARSLGLLATTMGRWRDAEPHFERALEMNARIGARPWLAHAKHDHGRMLLRRGGAGDRHRGLELLRQAATLYRELGMKQPV